MYEFQILPSCSVSGCNDIDPVTGKSPPATAPLSSKADASNLNSTEATHHYTNVLSSSAASSQDFSIVTTLTSNLPFIIVLFVCRWIILLYPDYTGPKLMFLEKREIYCQTQWCLGDFFRQQFKESFPKFFFLSTYMLNKYWRIKNYFIDN